MQFTGSGHSNLSIFDDRFSISSAPVKIVTELFMIFNNKSCVNVAERCFFFFFF